MGYIGYVAMLKEANISTDGLEMTKEKVQESFAHMVELKETYDTTDLTNHLSSLRRFIKLL
jgi:hypothetical protein